MIKHFCSSIAVRETGLRRLEAQLEVKPGDRISVVFRNAAGCYGKINGVLGWYYGRCSE